MILAALLALLAQDGNRLTYLDESDPYYPHLKFPKLTTPQWIGEEGVEAAIVLAIDDMRGPDKWETYLRPILERLKKIDNRAPVSIMTCTIDPNHVQLQKWIREGLNIDVHTVDHPCPLLQGGDFAKAKSTVDRCIELMSLIPNNKPVAYRMPCCDSLNTPSPRFYAEIFNRTTPSGKFLTIDTSVFNITTSADPDLPKELTTDADGREKFRKYLPFPSFVNTIENYPYPYVIGRLCWQFPCAVPSDWEAQHLNKPFSPITVADMKAAIDAVVLKQGVFNFVFHPHGWIKSDQVIEIIDHVVAKHGNKVKFLNFREAQERIDTHLLKGNPLRNAKGLDNGVRLLDLNKDGFLDVLLPDDTQRLWSPSAKAWTDSRLPFTLTSEARFGMLREGGFPSVIGEAEFIWHFDGTQWNRGAENPLRSAVYTLRMRDLDLDGTSEILDGGEGRRRIYSWKGERKRLPFPLPAPFLTDNGRDAGLRFVDLNGDGRDDVVFANEKEWSVHVFKDLEKGWELVASGKQGEPDAIPMISRAGTNNGAWFHSKHLWVQNEDTAKMPNLVDRRSYEQLLQKK